MFCSDIPNPIFLIFSSSVPSLLYYSHIPAMAISLFLGLFVFFKNKNLIGKILFLMSAVFFVWAFLNLILWTNNDVSLIMFTWSFFGFLTLALYILGLYFVYVFIDKKDISLNKKIIFAFLLLPIIIFGGTRFNLTSFILADCGPNENTIFSNYYYLASFLIFVWTIILTILRYKKANKEEKKPIFFIGLGMGFFMVSFFVTGYISSLLYDYGYTSTFELEQYGLFGMTFFMGVLAYMIVKFKAFNIKLIGAQALVIALVILVGSQFFFIDINNITSVVLTGVTMALALGFGYILIKSVKIDIERKEELQKMADSLAMANDQLRKLDNAKTEFISIASHQLRTPITAIKGFSSLVLEGSYGEISKNIQGAIEKIYVSSERLANLIEDLLNVSRIESGRLSFTFEKASVEKILKELYENFLLVAKTKKFYLDLKLPKTAMPEIKMDAGKIRELVSNFMDNALKYTEKGGVTVSAEIRDAGVIIDEQGFVKAGETAQFGKVVRVTVSDTGIGIPKEEIPYLFKKFSRGKDVSRLHVGGTGLGLYVGKAIADAHHGATWVESDGAGKGSRFIIEIPINSQTS